MNMKDQNFIVNLIKEKTQKVYRRGIKEVTDFLEPWESDICEDFLKKNKDKVKYLFFGGSPEAERKKLCIAPLEEDILPGDFDIIVIEATAKKIMREITHRDILGALMGTGIKREKTGDIFLIPQGGIILVDRIMASYLMDNFPIIKGNVFFLETYESDKYIFPDVEFTEKIVSVSSWRLDGFVAKAYNLTRSDAQSFINSKKVKVNHRENIKADYNLSENDIVSVRTKGRFIVKEELGKTKKDNFRVSINIY